MIVKKESEGEVDLLEVFKEVYVFDSILYEWFFLKIDIVMYYGGVGIIGVSFRVGLVILIYFFFGD